MKIDESFGDRRRTLVKKVESLLAISGGLVLLAAVAYGIADVVLTPAPISGKASLEDLVLGSSTVVIAVRVAAIFAAAFFVVSVVALMARRQWLIRIGPVEVSEQVVDLDMESERMDETLENAMQTIDSLRYELALSNSLLDRAEKSSGEAK